MTPVQITSSQTLQISTASIDYLDEIFKVFNECKRAMEKENIFQWTETYPGLAHLEEDIGNQHLYGLFDQGNCLGTLCLNSVQDKQYHQIPWIDSVGKFLVIHRLAIAPSHQRCGLGRLLMDFAEQRAAQGNYSSIRFDAYSGNKRVLEFYKQRGYQIRGEVNFPGRDLPFICFEKIMSGFGDKSKF